MVLGAFSSNHQQRDHDRGQGAEGEPERNPGDLTLGRQLRKLAPHEVQFIKDLSKSSRAVGLTERQAFGTEIIGHASQ